MELTESSSFASLRIPRFRRLWLANIVFNIGHLVQIVASSWLILELTESPLWVSAMIAAPTLPLLFLALHAGAAADLLDRRIVLVVSSLLMAVASTGMAIMNAFGLASPGGLVSLGLLLGVGIAFFNPAWQAIVPALVPQSLLPGAIALNSASGGLATALGPPLGGLLVATLAPGWSFAIATAGYLTILVTVLKAPGLEWESERDTMGVAIAIGLRYLRFSYGYVGLLTLGCVFGFFSAALRGAMLPNLTSDVLNGSAELYGVLLGSFGAGAIVGGLTRAHGSRLLGDRIVPGSILLFGSVGVVVGWAPNVPTVLACLCLAGLLWTWILATLNSIFQMLTPDWVRGRAMSAFVLSVFGFLPLGALASGQLGDAFGASASIIAFSVAVILVGMFALRMGLPVLETIDPPVLPQTEHSRRREDAPGASPVMVITDWAIQEKDLRGFADVLFDLRRLRLSTGAYQWGAYRSAHDPQKVTEVFMVHSWHHHLQQLRRLDTRGLAIIQHAQRFDQNGTWSTDHLVTFDVDAWSTRTGKASPGLEWTRRQRRRE